MVFSRQHCSLFISRYFSPFGASLEISMCFLKVKWTNKLKYFLLSLYLHQTLKRTILSEIWVKIFLPKPFWKIKDQNPSISENFTKTVLTWPRDRLETRRRQCWSFRAEKRSAQASAHPLSPAFVCLVLWEFWLFWLRLNEIHEVWTFAPCNSLRASSLALSRAARFARPNRRACSQATL